VAGGTNVAVVEINLEQAESALRAAQGDQSDRAAYNNDFDNNQFQCYLVSSRPPAFVGHLLS
jgi:hypothetical protein